MVGAPGAQDSLSTLRQPHLFWIWRFIHAASSTRILSNLLEWRGGAPMMSRLVKIVILLAVALVSAGAQWLNHPTPGIPRTKDGKPNLSAPAPRTADGKPDLSGIWQVETPKPGEIERLFSGLDELAHAVPVDDIREISRHFVNILVDLKPGEVSVRPGARVNRNGTSAACEPPTLPNLHFVPLPFRIVQT